MVTNDEVRALSGHLKLFIILSQRRLRCLGHVHRMAAEHITRQAVEWMLNGR